MPLSASYRPLQPDNSIRFNFCVLYAALTIIPNNKEIIIIDQHLVQNSAIILDNVGFKILETFSKNYAWAACLPCKYHNIPTLGCGYTFYKQTSALSAQSQLSLAMHVNVKQDMECWCIMLKEQESKSAQRKL